MDQGLNCDFSRQRPELENYVMFLVIGPSILVYILIENQQMNQIYHFIVMSSQMLLYVSAYQRHHQGAHMILTR
jgi:hypothetical protein